MGGDELRAEVSRIRKENEAASDVRLTKLQEQISLLQQELDELHSKYTGLEKDYRDLTDKHLAECKRRAGLEEEVMLFMRKEQEALGEVTKERTEREKVTQEVEVRVREVKDVTKRARDAEAQSEER